MWRDECAADHRWRVTRGSGDIRLISPIYLSFITTARTPLSLTRHRTSVIVHLVVQSPASPLPLPFFSSSCRWYALIPITSCAVPYSICAHCCVSSSSVHRAGSAMTETFEWRPASESLHGLFARWADPSFNAKIVSQLMTQHSPSPHHETTSTAASTLTQSPI